MNESSLLLKHIRSVVSVTFVLVIILFLIDPPFSIVGKIVHALIGINIVVAAVMINRRIQELKSSQE